MSHEINPLNPQQRPPVDRSDPSNVSTMREVGVFLLLASSLFAIDRWLVPAGVWQGFLCIIGSFIAVLVITRKRGESLRELGLGAPSRLVTLPLWVFVILVSTLIVAGGGQFLVGRWVDSAVDISKFESLHGNFPLLLGSLVSIWVTAALFEEVVFRGFLLRHLLRITGSGFAAVAGAILLHAVLFGVLHAYQGLLGVITTALVAVVFGVFYVILNRNLWALILTHGLIDSLGVVQFYLYGVPAVAGGQS